MSPRYPRSIRFHIWPPEVADRALEDLTRLTPEIRPALGDVCEFLEVTVGKRSVGVIAAWPFDTHGYFAKIIPMEDRDEPPDDLWLDDARGSDLDAMMLWLACDASALEFGKIHDELRGLRRIDTSPPSRTCAQARLELPHLRRGDPRGASRRSVR